jgi:hypothetical protein
VEASAGTSGEWRTGATDNSTGRTIKHADVLFLCLQVLLKKLLDVFPFYLNFLDGDVLFRRLHAVADVFVDDNRDLSVLTGPHASVSTTLCMP